MSTRLCLLLAVLLVPGQLAWPANADTQPTTQPAPAWADLLKPSVITLHYTDAPLQTVMDDFTKQAGADMGTHRKEIVDYMQDKKITINLDHGSFWEALHLISQNAGLVLPGTWNVGSTMKLEIAGRGAMAADFPTDTATIAGPFIIIPQKCTLSRTVLYRHSADNYSQVSLQLKCACEPKLQVMGAINNDLVQKMVDEKGHDLLGAAGDDAGLDLGWLPIPRRSWYWPLNLELNDYPDIGKKIAIMHGIIKADVCTKSTAFVVEDVMKAGETTQKIGEMTITFHKAIKAGGMSTLQMSLILPAKNNDAIESQQPWQVGQALTRDMQVTDTNGRSMQVNGQMNGKVTAGRIDLTVNVSPAWTGGVQPPQVPPKKLVWEIPTESRPLEIPFEIHDLPLPQ